MDYRIRLRQIREDRDLTQTEIGKILNKSRKATIILKPAELN